MLLLRNHTVPDIDRLEVYKQHGGYRALKIAETLSPEKLISLIEESGLRGRGGAGYPSATKLKAALNEQRYPHYFVCNIAEGEPGSFKDRFLLKNPHQILEATAIAALSMKAERAFIYLRGSFIKEEQSLIKALREVESMLPVSIVIHRGEDSYIAGEETAMIESLEGKPAIPRTKPPRPSEYGLWDMPTVVNNVETICNLIPIVSEGPQSFRRYGTKDSPGTKLFSISGKIQKPGVYELPLGTPLSELLYGIAGGPLEGRNFVAIFPGGYSTPLLPVEINPDLDFESMQKAGTALGTGGIIVLDDSVDLLDVAIEISDFFSKESCKTCPPCTIGTSESAALFKEFKENGNNETILKIQEFCEMMKYRGNCGHNRAAAAAFLNLFGRFPDVFRPLARQNAANH